MDYGSNGTVTDKPQETILSDRVITTLVRKKDEKEKITLLYSQICCG
jgi:hypothetical protein